MGGVIILAMKLIAARSSDDGFIVGTAVYEILKTHTIQK